MVRGNADVYITAGYTQIVVGFSWTNGAYLNLQQILHADAGTTPAHAASTGHVK